MRKENYDETKANESNRENGMGMGMGMETKKTRHKINHQYINEYMYV